MIDFQSLSNLPEITFKAKDKPILKELADYIDHMKAELFNDRWSQATKKHIKTSLVLYIRTMQKQLAPMGYHYKAQDMKGKEPSPPPELSILSLLGVSFFVGFYRQKNQPPEVAGRAAADEPSF